jgi:4-diphosphocytidyl-2-C-methyl-D-erythritol kinase
VKAWPAPAKINLLLRVIGRRPDGYHLLQTVFQFLDYGDTLRFTPSDDDRITRARPIPEVAEAADLTVRAARLLRERSGITRGVVIDLEKRIPAGGGLGGGSSDAATTLLALNELWDVGLSRPELAKLGLELGADVPVFLHGHAAWAEGVGEILTPIELDEPWYVVLSPKVTVSTRAIFTDPELTHHSPPITIRDFQEGHGLRNDLESLVRRRYPQVDEAIGWLGGHGEARMTGSGGCVFLKVTDATEGRRILEQAPKTLSGFVARGMNRHPI